MPSATAPHSPGRPTTLQALGLLFGLHLAARLTELLLADRAALATAAGGLLVLWGAEKAGLRLLPGDPPSLGEWARELGLGAAVATLGFGLLVGAGLFLGAKAELGGGGGSLLLALVRAGFRGARDELVLTGVAVVAAAHLRRPGLAPLAAALTHLADVAGAEGATVGGLALGAAAGALSGALWTNGSGARAVAWSAAWIFLAGLGLRGAIVDLGGISFVLQPSHRASGALAWVACGVLAALAVATRWAPAGPAEAARSAGSRSEKSLARR